jgi:hypothetical protein
MKFVEWTLQHKGFITGMSSAANPVQYAGRMLEEWCKKCKRMGLRTEYNWYVHNLYFADDQVVVTRGAENANFTVRKLE